MKYRLISLAAEDIATAMGYYESQSLGLGGDFLDEFESAVERIYQCPQAWRRISVNHRRIILRRFPYAVLYYCHGEEIIISGVMNLRMDPEQQNRRLGGV